MTDRIEFRFSDESVESFDHRPAPGKRLYAWDATEPGLGLAVTAAGAKSFFCRVRFYGSSPRVTIGRFPGIDVDRARRDARAIKVAADNGVDPRDALKLAGTRRAAGITVGQFYEVFVEEYARQNRKRWKVDQREVSNYWKPIRDIPMNQLTSDQVRRWYKNLGTSRGGATAEKQINLLRTVFNKAMQLRDSNGRPYARANPAVAAAVTREWAGAQRDRYLQAPELHNLFRVLSTFEPALGRHAILLGLYTAARHDNLAKMRFSDIDFENEVWVIPKDHFKSQSRTPHSHVVPLVRQALRILKLRREMCSGTWVFPSRRGKDRPTANFTGHWHRAREEAGLPDVVFHDLRRTTASWMATTNASWPVIMQFLGHRLPGVTQIYARLAVGPVREAAQIAVDTMLREGGVDE